MILHTSLRKLLWAPPFGDGTQCVDSPTEFPRVHSFRETLSYRILSEARHFLARLPVPLLFSYETSLRIPFYAYIPFYITRRQPVARDCRIFTIVPFWKPRHFNGSGGKKDSRRSSLLTTTTTILVTVPIAMMYHRTKTSIDPLDFACVCRDIK
jgi:hypothetical protein